jgi:hypothetical protein
VVSAPGRHLVERPWKGISFLVLDQAGVRLDRDLAAIPYRRPDGTTHRWHYVTLRGRYWWGPGDGLIPLGLETLPPPGEAEHRALLVAEGESDCFALREAFAATTTDNPIRGYHAIALPGAGTWRPDWRHHFEPFPLVYLVGDGDASGRRMMDTILADVPWARPVMLPAGEDARSILQRDGARALDLHLERADRAATVWAAMRRGLTLQETEALLRGRPRSMRPNDRAIAQASGHQAAAVTLTDVEATFARHFHLEDYGVVHAVLAVVVANSLPGDPVWALVVGPSSSGKTEPLMATLDIPGTQPVGTLTEAGLLSGVKQADKKPGAKGGLLREIGDRGIIVMKDFGSILAMSDRGGRPGVLQALREVYDGRWTRYVGSDGGRELMWEGKVGLIGAVTDAIDQHHAALAALGERFVYYRLKLADYEAQAHASIAHADKVDEMRRELREIVAAFVDTIDTTTVPKSRAADDSAVAALATFVARARSPVIRGNYDRDIEQVPAPEAPGRLAAVLHKLHAATCLIGLDNTAARNLIVRIGLDSMPANRHRAIELLRNATERLKVDEINLGISDAATRRVLGDLEAHGVVDRQKIGKPDGWALTDDSRDLLERATRTCDVDF